MTSLSNQPLSNQPLSKQAPTMASLSIRALLLTSLLALLPRPAQAVPLTVVNVGAPAINCVFTTAVPCTVTVSDSVGPIPVIGGRLQSRTFSAKPGSAASGLTAYEYRVDLTNAVEIGRAHV